MNHYDCTFYGLHKWHKHMFEKLGWIAIAKTHDHDDVNIMGYKDSISRLKQCLIDKKGKTKDSDRKDDLQILIDNIDCLNMCADKLINGTTYNTAKEAKHPENGYDATFHGLHCWMKNKFEKLGWMCLANKNGNKILVDSYMHSIESLKDSLTKKLQELTEIDSKKDIKILHNHVCILNHTANMLLDSNMHTAHTTHTIHKRTKKAKHNV